MIRYILGSSALAIVLAAGPAFADCKGEVQAFDQGQGQALMKEIEANSELGRAVENLREAALLLGSRGDQEGCEAVLVTLVYLADEYAGEAEAAGTGQQGQGQAQQAEGQEQQGKTGQQARRDDQQDSQQAKQTEAQQAEGQQAQQTGDEQAQQTQTEQGDAQQSGDQQAQDQQAEGQQAQQTQTEQGEAQQGEAQQAQAQEAEPTEPRPVQTGQVPEQEAEGQPGQQQAATGQDEAQQEGVAQQEGTAQEGGEEVLVDQRTRQIADRTVAFAKLDMPLDAARLLEREVRNFNETALGEVEGVLVSQTGLSHVLVEQAGFLGIGDKTIAIPVSKLRWNPEEEIFYLNVTEEQIENAPEYTTSNDDWVAEINDRWYDDPS